MATPNELVAALERAGEEYAGFIETQPLEKFHHRPAPEEWTAAELTGHVAEFPATFAAQARRLAQNPGVQLGRSLDDPGRLAAVARLAGAGPVEGAAAVRRCVQEALASLREIPPVGWSVRGQHPRLGEVTVVEVAERFIVSHLQEHLEQARATVGA